jgi:EAL domain-containing protein (putative c-di-GMP-specific phosphodiesterase class I)
MTEDTTHDNVFRSLANKEFKLFFHPQIEFATGRIAALEVLLRWYPDHCREILPGNFIPAFEASGDIIAVGAWVIHSACRQLRQWRNEFSIPDNCRLCINVSAPQFDDDNLYNALQNAIARYDIATELIELELTESRSLADSKNTRRNIGQIHALGVRMSVDDFGTGYSSLAYLKQYCFHTLKIDRSIIQGIVAGDVAQAIVDSVLQLAHRLEIDVVAEGVETPEQFSILLNMGCDLGQGYLFTSPLPASAVPQYIRRWSELINPMFQQIKGR